ncbi:hypothetical protein GE061_019168 [Apolygus lucorum]|uniref:Uncharacterized protein n=1 Tax=Apolygus lucorum TaxID=248454 RepID=A0A6A4JTA0_APOLU|nr:hypothetical protein GE061_019168 [Apolygus lucorum]
MQAVAVARSLLLIALAIFLAGDLVSLVNRLAYAQDSTSGNEVAHHSDALPQKERLAQLTRAVKNSCLPKLICELNAAPEKERLNQKAKTLLQLIRDTSISMTAEVSSRYHFAAHMGQLIAGVDGTGCHNFYPGCPLPSVKVLSLLNKPSLF